MTNPNTRILLDATMTTDDVLEMLQEEGFLTAWPILATFEPQLKAYLCNAWMEVLDQFRAKLRMCGNIYHDGLAKESIED